MIPNTLGWAATAKDAEVLVEKLVAGKWLFLLVTQSLQWLGNLKKFSNHMLMSRQLRDMPWEMMQAHNPKWKVHKGVLCVCFT